MKKFDDHSPNTSVFSSNFNSCGMITALGLLALPWASSASADTVKFTSSGSFTAPAGVTSITVECWGGGGAGGGASRSSSGNAGGSGGGGGAYAKQAITVTPLTVYPFTIAAAATCPTSGFTNGQTYNGSAVTFTGDLVSVTANGGTGGGCGVNATGALGAGGTAGTGLLAAWAGGNGGASTNNGGAGGSGASDLGAGNNASGTGAGAAKAGTDADHSGGAGAPGKTGGSGAGNTGSTIPGGGGAGARILNSTGSFAGSPGAKGQIIITYTIPPNFKANNALPLNDASSWTAFVPIGAIAEWNNTVAGANTSSLGADLTFSGVKISDPGGLVTIDPGNTLTLGAAAVDLDLSTATQDLTLNCNLAMGAANVWDVASGRTATLGGAVSGTATVAKQGAGTAILSGANTYNGTTTVSAGTLVLSGSTTTTGNLTIGNTAAKAVLNIPTGGTMTGGIFTVGSLSGASAAMNIKGGTLTMAASSDNDASSFGTVNGAYGAFTISSGSYNQQRFMFGGTTSTATGGTGVGLIKGGTVNNSGWLILARSGPADGTLTITGGTLNHASAANDIAVGLGSGTASANTGRAELNVAGGLVDNTGRRVTFSGGTASSFHWAGTGVVNLNAGTLLTNSFNYDSLSPNANSYLNLSGGTLKAAISSTTLLPSFSPSGTGINRVFVNGPFGTYVGGAKIDTNGFDSTISANLLTPTGNGVTGLTIDNAGSGYIGAPAVKILDGGLPSTATAYAEVDTDPSSATFGQITSVVITNPGVIAGAATVSLVGGGGSGAAVSVSATGPNTSGGITKLGNGTLTLSGANTYTGPTNVDVGTLKASTAGSATTNITVADSAANGVFVATNGGQWVNTGSLTHANNSTVLVEYGSTAPSITLAPIQVDNLSLGTNLTMRIEGAGFVAGSSYPLLTWTGSGPVGASGFSTLIQPLRVTGNLSVTGSTLFYNVTAVTPLTLSWNTGDGTWDTTTANWVDGALVSRTYVNPADTVVFGDASGATGNPIITLNSTFSPPSVTMNSTSHDYTISGTGAISGSGSLTLAGTNTRTLTLLTVNTYTGPTTISGGTLQIGGAGRLGGGNYAGDIAISGATTLQYASSAAQTLSGILSGSGSLNKDVGSGTLTLSGANTYTGSTTVNGTLALANVNALSGTTAITISGGGILSTSTDAITIGAPVTLGLAATDSTVSFSLNSVAVGTLTLNSAISGAGNLIFTTPNVNSGGQLQTILLGGTNTYSGTTTLNTGNTSSMTTVKAGVTNALPVTTVLNLTGGNGSGSGRTVTYDLNGKNQTLAGLTNSISTLTARFQRINNTSLTPATLTINNTTDFTFGGLGVPSTFNGNPVNPSAAIVGNLALTKSGVGVFTVSTTRGYSGDTTVTAGTLSLGGGNGANNASTVTIAATGAKVKLTYAGTDIVGALVIGSTTYGPGVYGHTDSGADNGGLGVGNLNAFFEAGSGTLTVQAGYAGWTAGPFLGTLSNTSAAFDFDNGGLDTGVEWVVGGDPTNGSDDAARAPTFDNTTDPDFFIFTYRRTDAASTDTNTAIKVEYGSDISGWTPAVAGPDVIITPTNDFFGASPGVDKVEVKIRRTLAVGGKLFARLNVVIAP